MDLGSGHRALGVSLAHLTCQPLFSAHFPLPEFSCAPGDPGNTLGCHTAASAPCFGSFEAHERSVPSGKGCNEICNEIGQICLFTSAFP